MSKRKCYVLTCNEKSERTQFSKHLLEKIGFEVNLFKAVPNKDKVLSNKISMMQIYNIIAHGEDEWVYVFEDDINILEEVKIDEIIKYETISSQFFYLGVCESIPAKHSTSDIKIDGYTVETVSENKSACLHAIALSKDGAKELLEMSHNSSEEYMDVIVNQFAMKYKANIVRYDLHVSDSESSHRGLFYQDRNQFESTIP
jgi:hypothetical protein